jgi:Ribbon-helix-helix protein, copG family
MRAKVINMTLPRALLAKVDAAARAEGRSRSELLREAARRYVSELHGTGKGSTPLLSRLRALAVKGPHLAASDIDRKLYGKRRSR